MKKFLLILLILPFFLQGQTSNWDINFNSDRGFIENKGQFDNKNWQSSNPIEFATKESGWYTFFGKKGITYRVEKMIRNPKKKKGEHGVPSRVHMSELVMIEFLGANPNVQLVKGIKKLDYHTYSAKDFSPENIDNRNHINSYEKITYKNIYNNIDIEYTIHKDGGLKYNIILHPGADPSQVKMKYKTAHTDIKNEFVDIKINNVGQLEINMANAKIIEHAPVTYYQISNIEIHSNYKFVNNILTFELGNYDNSKKVIIDPWVVIPVWDDGDFTREVETDAAGNVFVIGGETPMQLRKYTPAGALVWTYNTPFDTIGEDWLGTLATDANGVSYVTQGTDPRIERINDNGATFTVVWSVNGAGLDEYWTITFNCDNTKLIVGGTRLSFGLPIVAEAKIFEIDLNTGNVSSDLTVSSQNASGIIGIVEVRSIAPTKNSKYVYLSHIDVGLVNQNLTSCGNALDFEVSNQKELSYKCENYLSAAQNGGGLKAIIANDDYFYTHRGDEILQWDITNGALLNTVNLPGGSGNQPFLSEWVVHCSGLDVDAAGNVYAGSMDRVVKYDANLNFISQSMTAGGFTVYDVSVNSNGEVLAVGALLDNSTPTGRGGRIESLSMTAGVQYATVCCDPNFCPVGPLCTTDAAVNLNPNVIGGTWSSVPATAGLSAGGIFDPAVAGPGTYVITYTLACGTNTETIIVGSCTAMTVCIETNGDLTVTGGTGPYNWDDLAIITITPTNSAECTTCGGTWNPGFPPFVPASCSVTSCSVTGWINFGTGVTVTPTVGADTIQITDGLGNTVVINDISALPPCSAVCDATITPAGPFCENDAPVILTAAQGGGTWGGPGITNTSTGAFDPATAGPGTHNITYVLGCGDNDAISIIVNPLPNSGIDGTVSICGNATSINLFDSLGGTPDLGGTWAPTLTSGTGIFDPAVDPAVTYTYTVTNSCGSSNNDVIVTITPAPNTGLDGAISLCPTDPATDLFLQLGGTPNGGGSWLPAMTSGTGMFDPASDPAGTYTYTVTNSCGSSSNDVIVTITANPDPGTNGTVSICGNATSINLFDSLNGTPSTGGGWTPALTSGTGVFDPAVDVAGTYTYTVTDCAGNPLTANVIVTINPAPNTGIDGAISLCPTDPATDLFLQLGGTPNGGGSWLPAMTSGTGMFDPASDPAGTYTYTVTNSCGSSSNDVIVTITSNPLPGTNGTVSICGNATSINLFDSLNGTPSAGGGWTPALTSGTGVFDPAIDAAGTYTYTVTDCAGNPLTADVIVTVNPAPNTGTDGAITLCNADPAADLFLQLGGTPDLGGTWSPVLTSGTGMFDPAVDPAGTYTYTVTNSCGSSSNNVVVTITSCTVPTGGYTVSDSIICEGECVDFTDQSAGVTSWLWIFNGGSPSTSTNQNPTNICFAGAGTYTIEQIVTNVNGSDTITSSIVVNTTPTVNAGSDVTVELGQSAYLNATGTNGTYTWSPPTWLSCVICVDPIATPDETITYTVTVVDSNGCSASDNVTVIVDFDYVIWVPNIFSPNGDGNNDVLFVRGAGVEQFKFFLYNRWGEKVFQTQDLNTGWNGKFRGKKVNNAVFVYYLEATFKDGTEVSQKGDITLIR